MIIAILLGLVANLTGLGAVLEGNAFTGALLQVTQYLAAMIVPVILVVVKHGRACPLDGVKQALPVVAIRFMAVLALALLLNHFVVRAVLGLPPLVEAALFTLLILPPPFIVPIFPAEGAARRPRLRQQRVESPHCGQRGRVHRLRHRHYRLIP